MPWSRKIPFQVDVAGIIHIMGISLYSRPEAAIRELIQNAHDAILRRRRKELNYKGRIEVRQSPEANELEFQDDGIGLNADEAERYLGTLGIGMTGLLKEVLPGSSSVSLSESGGDGLIGQFGIGLFSAFMLADEMTVISRRIDADEGICWRAGKETEIELSSHEKETAGTIVRLKLKPDCADHLLSAETLERIICDYADFLSVPIHLNQSAARANVSQAAWLEATVEDDALTEELQTYFEETPLDVIPVRIRQPVELTGALYVTPQRTPGFAGIPVVTATVRRMVISRRVQDLLPDWASFLRGAIEFPAATPTASREDLVRDARFLQARAALDQTIRKHFEELADNKPEVMESVLAWHRYSWAGAALGDAELRKLLARTYKFQTTAGPLTFQAIAKSSAADPVFEAEFDAVVWYHTDRRQERWMNTLFAQSSVPCVHAVRSFEESLLVAMVGDQGDAMDVRLACPSANGFADQILGMRDLEEADAAWQDFLSSTGAKIHWASFRDDLPVLAFLNEHHELMKTLEDLKQQGVVPGGFQRLIDAHFSEGDTPQNEVILNRNHRLVGRALEQSTATPLASVLRLLVVQALGAAGASIPRPVQRQQVEDLDWIAEALWGRK